MRARTTSLPQRCGWVPAEKEAVPNVGSDAVADYRAAVSNCCIWGSSALGDPCAGNAATMQSTTRRLISMPRWPMPSTVMVSTSAWAGTDRGRGTMMSSPAVTANHRTPTGTGAEARRRNKGEPGRRARSRSPNGSRSAQGDPPNGEPKVMTVSTSPTRPPLAMASAMTTPPRLCPTRCNFVRAGLRQGRLHRSDGLVGKLLHRISQWAVRDRVDHDAAVAQRLGDHGPA